MSTQRDNVDLWLMNAATLVSCRHAPFLYHGWSRKADYVRPGPYLPALAMPMWGRLLASERGKEWLRSFSLGSAYFDNKKYTTFDFDWLDAISGEGDALRNAAPSFEDFVGDFDVVPGRDKLWEVHAEPVRFAIEESWDDEVRTIRFGVASRDMGGLDLKEIAWKHMTLYVLSDRLKSGIEGLCPNVFSMEKCIVF